MSEPANEKWMKWVALTTAFMAVCAALTTMYMGKYSSRAVMLQGQESDQWAHYQAKSIKGYNNEMQRQLLEIMTAGGTLPQKAQEKCDVATSRCAAEIERYEKEKKEIKEKAEGLAKRKEVAQQMAGNFGYSLIFVQISIMLSSLASMTKRKYLWQIGLSAIGGWLFFVLDAVFLFY